jgi:L-lactate dehydrogenase complex protein LldG
MSEARTKILSAIRHKTGEEHTAAAQRLQQHPRNTIPARVNQDLLPLFKKQAEKVNAEIHELAAEELQQTLENYFASRKKLKIKISNPALLQKILWENINVEVSVGAAAIDDSVSVTECFCAVAETGTLVMTSNQATPTTLNFLAETHIVILDQSQIVGSYENAFDQLRRLDSPPRSVNFITGPSRTGDIEQKILIGAHGPRELIIFLICHPTV